MAWQDIQQNTFTRWCNDFLKLKGQTIENLKTDLRDGIKLCNLMEAISGKPVGKWHPHPRVNPQKIENVSMALDFIKSEGIKLVNIGTEDIVSGNLRAILGLIWTLILRYEIKGNHESDGSAMDDLLKWVRSKIPEYDIKNFTTDWNDGRAVCALTNALRPGLIPNHREMDPNNKLANATHGIDVAFKELGVDPLILPSEMTHPKVDRLAMVTYIAQFRNLPEKVDDSRGCRAYGPGLVEGIVDHDAKFKMEKPKGSKGTFDVKVEGPTNEAKVEIKDLGNGAYDVAYKPNIPGTWKVSVTLDGKHIPGSVFTVRVLQQESLGGEGKIRVYFATTSASEKFKKDKISLQNLLMAKKVHLREDFEPWVAVDIMDPPDREIVFRKAGTRTLPIVFVDDVYVGDYDKLAQLNEIEQLDALLKMERAKFISEADHIERMKKIPMDPREKVM